MPRDSKSIQDEIDATRAKIKRLNQEMDVFRSAGDSLDDGQMQRVDRLVRGHDTATKRLAELLDEQRDAVRSLAFDSRNLETGDGSRRRAPDQVMRSNIQPWDVNGDYPTTGPELIRHALAAVEQVDEPEHDSEIDRAKYERLVEAGASRPGSQADRIAQWVLATSDPAYRSAFRAYVADPMRGHLHWSREEAEAFRRAHEISRTAMSLTAANGGVLVPFTLDPSVILTNSGVADPIRSISTIKTIATDDWNGVTSAGVTAEWLGEGVEAADASPTFTQPTITPKKAAALVFGSYEVLADSGFASELSRLMADAKARLEGAAFATGNVGASRPRGVVAATVAVTASIVTSATTNAFVVADVYRTADALRPRDAAAASWIANKRIYSLIRQMDTSGGSSFWANLGMGVPAQLLGQPQYECSTMANAVTTGGNILLAGNFKQYYIVDRIGMQLVYEPMIRSTGNGRPTGQAGWFCHWRVGADVVDPDAFRILQLQQVAAATALA
jgi:HK97 family phage major capsid protein